MTNRIGLVSLLAALSACTGEVRDETPNASAAEKQPKAPPRVSVRGDDFVLAVDESGKILGMGSHKLASHRDGPRHEQNPEEWWTAVTAASRVALKDLSAETIGRATENGRPHPGPGPWISQVLSSPAPR